MTLKEIGKEIKINLGGMNNGDGIELINGTSIERRDRRWSVTEEDGTHWIFDDFDPRGTEEMVNQLANDLRAWMSLNPELLRFYVV